MRVLRQRRFGYWKFVKLDFGLSTEFFGYWRFVKLDFGQPMELSVLTQLKQFGPKRQLLQGLARWKQQLEVCRLQYLSQLCFYFKYSQTLKLVDQPKMVKMLQHLESFVIQLKAEYSLQLSESLHWLDCYQLQLKFLPNQYHHFLLQLIHFENQYCQYQCILHCYLPHYKDFGRQQRYRQSWIGCLMMLKRWKHRSRLWL